MINRNDEAAFPVPIGQTDERQWGMSLRDWFAGKAMEGMMGDPELAGDYKTFATWAYGWADAMMEARKEAKQ
jgi:hypothetical protein